MLDVASIKRGVLAPMAQHETKVTISCQVLWSADSADFLCFRTALAFPARGATLMGNNCLLHLYTRFSFSWLSACSL
jgi:hypothetical protein